MIDLRKYRTGIENDGSYSRRGSYEVGESYARIESYFVQRGVYRDERPTGLKYEEGEDLIEVLRAQRQGVPVLGRDIR